MKDLNPVGVLRRISICRNAISKDFFDKFRPNPDDSRTDVMVDFTSRNVGVDFVGRLTWGFTTGH